MYNSIYAFFKDRFNVDLSNTEYYYTTLSGRAGFYNPVIDTVFLDDSKNPITRELTLVHELTHRLVYLLSYLVDDEEEFCKGVTREYVKEAFGEQGLLLLHEWLS